MGREVLGKMTKFPLQATPAKSIAEVLRMYQLVY
jgi:hypothetical protein